MAKKTEVVKKNMGKVPAPVIDYGELFGAGFEKDTPDDVLIPFIQIIQDLSPQLKEANEKFIPEAKLGDLFNSVTNEILPGKITFIPAVKQRAFVEWIPRKKGGGFVARYKINDEIVLNAKAAAGGDGFGKLSTRDGNDLVDTVYIIGLLVPEVADDEPEMAMISFTSTKLGVYRKWNTQMNKCQVLDSEGRKRTPPLFAHVVEISTWLDKRPGGEFYNLAIKSPKSSMAESLMTPDNVLFQAAIALKGMFMSGKVKAADEGPEGGSTRKDNDVDDVF